MINNKGFTMVELLVAMAIMGLLIIMAFPTIRAIQTNNNNTKYEEYGKSVISASKLYVDSYEEDIFDPDVNNQYKIINLEQLVQKDLLKDISLSDSTCVNGHSNVRVVKYNNDYAYCLNLICTNGEKEVYKEKDKTGSCKGIESRIKTVTYKYKNYTPYTTEVLVGDDNYSLLDPAKMNFDFKANKETFKGWTLDSNPNDSSTTYPKGSIYPKTINDNITFYAYGQKWKYKINYKKNSDGTYNGTMNSKTCTCGLECKLDPVLFTRVGYHFDKWQEDSTHTYSSLADVKNTIGDRVRYDGEQFNLTGIFAINRYTLTFDKQGGTGTCNSITKNHGQKWGTLCTPSKSNNTFGGWFTGANGTGTKIDANTVATSSYTVYAKWTPNPGTVTLKYNDNGGTGCSSKSIVKVKNQRWGTLCTPTRARHTFAGWYDGNTKVTSSTKATKNVTVVAHWTPNSIKYTVKFKFSDKYEKISSRNKDVTKTCTALGDGTCTVQTPNIVIFGDSKKTWCGKKYNIFFSRQWNTKNDGSGTAYNISTNYQIKSNMTLNAYYKPTPRYLNKKGIIKVGGWGCKNTYTHNNCDYSYRPGEDPRNPVVRYGNLQENGTAINGNGNYFRWDGRWIYSGGTLYLYGHGETKSGNAKKSGGACHNLVPELCDCKSGYVNADYFDVAPMKCSN